MKNIMELKNKLRKKIKIGAHSVTAKYWKQFLKQGSPKPISGSLRRNHIAISIRIAKEKKKKYANLNITMTGKARKYAKKII